MRVYRKSNPKGFTLKNFQFLRARSSMVERHPFKVGVERSNRSGLTESNSATPVKLGFAEVYEGQVGLGHFCRSISGKSDFPK